eukprot:2272873-Prymnesium_polylepis.1
MSKSGAMEPSADYQSATDPYEETPPLANAADLDTLGKAPSSTPAMSSWYRIAVLVMVAAMLYQRKDGRHAGGDVVEGLTYQPEIRISGSRQSFVGGGDVVGAHFVAGMYIERNKMATMALSAFAGAPADELDHDGLFQVLADAQLGQSLLLQWTATSSSAAALAALGDAAGAAAGPLNDAVRPLFGEEVLEGADLFLVCKDGTLAIAYAGTPAHSVRNTAKVGATVSDSSVCPALFAAFLGREPLWQGVKEGFADRSKVWM